MTTLHHTHPFITKALLIEALLDTLRKLAPQQQWKNPVMFVVEVGSMLTTGLCIKILFTGFTLFRSQR